MLDAAEHLFARHGFDGVSVRDITTAAGVDVALISYHFGGKRELFTAVFQRRAEILNVERSALLEHVRRAALPGVPPLEEIINAFTQPLLERSARGGAGWKSYFALVAQVNNSPTWGPVLMTEHFDPIVAKFIAVLREAMPDCPPQEIYWGYQFLTGALTLTFAETGRIDKLSGGLCRSSDLDSVHQRLARLCRRRLSCPQCGRAAQTRRLSGGRGRTSAATPAPAHRNGATPHRDVANPQNGAKPLIALIQRVLKAQVRIDGELPRRSTGGLLALIGVRPADTGQHARRLIERILQYRVFDDGAGRMNRSLTDVDGGLLLVPQFTLAADTHTGTRPGLLDCCAARFGPQAVRVRGRRRTRAPSTSLAAACSAPTCRCH